MLIIRYLTGTLTFQVHSDRLQVEPRVFSIQRLIFIFRWVALIALGGSESLKLHRIWTQTLRILFPDQEPLEIGQLFVGIFFVPSTQS